MTAELICVGTEILLGNIVNTNAQFISSQCALLGISMYFQTVVGDNAERLSETIKLALGRSDIVILCGGLGPTEDDITKEVCADIMGFELVEDAHTRAHIKEYLENSVFKVIPDNNWKQAVVPKGSIILDNPNGTAPGLILEKDSKTAILLPGPPNELIPLMSTSVTDYLKDKQPECIISRMMKICGIGESAVEEMLIDLIDAQTNPTIATYAKTGEVHIRITAKANDEAEANALLDPLVDEIKDRLGIAVYSTDEDGSLESVLVSLLKENGLKISTAESCTGGLLAGRIINVAGASDVLEEGFITYSDRAKQDILGVSVSTLETYGAVSEQTAREMAEGGAKASGSDVCVSVTGLAGPGGGTEDKPVGLVYIGCYVNGHIESGKYQFHGNREKIRDLAVVRALDLTRRTLIDTI